MSGSDPTSVLPRTALAWQRTALAVGAGGLVVTRLAVTAVGWPALVCAAVVVPGALGAWVATARRRRPSDGAVPLLLVVLVVLLAATELLALLG